MGHLLKYSVNYPIYFFGNVLVSMNMRSGTSLPLFTMILLSSLPGCKLSKTIAKKMDKR